MSRRRQPAVFWRGHGRGPALVLINGWSASGLAWPRGWVRELEERFRVIAIDNRGSGYSRFAPTPFTIADLADDVVAVLDEAEIERTTVLGMSMGGLIAQELALRAPHRLAGLLLTATRPPVPAYIAPRGGDTMWGMLMPARRGESLSSYLTRLWSSATGPGFAERHPEAIAELVAQIVERPTSREMLVEQLRAVNGCGHSERLATITAPTIVVHGAADPLIAVENGRKLAELIPDARYVELPGVGHLPPLEAPEALRDALQDLCAGAEREGLQPQG